MLPEGWQSTVAGDQMDVLTGFAFKSSDYSEAEQDIKLLRGDNIVQGSLRWKDVKKIAIKKVVNLDRYFLETGDMVIALDRTWIPAGIKMSEITKEDLPCLLVQRVARLRAKKGLLQSLLKQVFGGHRFEQFVKKVQTETAVPHISPNDLREFPVALPPLPEQRKIAAILFTWDQTIETVEALIANAQRQKKALMQQLLPRGTQPPLKRLPGFSGEWELKRLGAFGSTFAGLSGKTKKDFGQGAPYIPYKNVFQNSVVDEEFLDYVGIEDGENQNSVRYGDVIFTTSSETPDEVGMSSVVLSKLEPLYLNSFCFGFRPTFLDTLHPEYAAHFFRCDGFRRLVYRLAQGSTRYNISKTALLKEEFLLPLLAEQMRIGSVLSEAAAEIAAYQSQRDALTREKAALMQQLLTGKLRVKVPEGEAVHA